ncbi:MAG: protease modulator HflK [Sedimentisphaerales bacterium]|nr:protease modulator HflK [Sedimentisphaerales bacterium]
MKEQKEDNKDMHVPDTSKPAVDELDTAGRSLSEALRMSFIILKVIMIVLVLAFLASGFKTVDSNEQALVLRFGKIRGEGEKRILGPGLHWIFPYPIDEIVKIPVQTQVNLPIDSFWYYMTQSEILSGQMRPVRPGQPLKPLQDGYCLTRGESQNEAIGDFAGSDYNIVHSKWQLTYQIDDPEQFFIDTYIEDVKPGDIYFNVITESIKPLLKDVFENAVVTALVNYTIDEAISSQDRIPKHVRRLVQEKLDKIESGIKVVSVQLTASECPRQVKEAFEAPTRASQQSKKVITDAEAYAANTLNEAGGSVAGELFAALHDGSIDEQTREQLWSQLAGAAGKKIADARAYRTKVVERARANADYLESILPEYRQRPKLVLQNIYLDAMENILKNADEKFVVQTTKGSKGTEIRVLLNRDPTIKKKKKSTGQTEQNQEQ